MGGCISWVSYVFPFVLLPTEKQNSLHIQISDGGVHSHITHLFALLETAKEQGVPNTYIHFLGDGRDTAPRSATIYLQQLEDFTKKLGYGQLATIIGRYYAMDRDKRWERVKVAVDGLLRGEGEKLEATAEGVDNAIKAVERNYEKDVTDEFLKPIIVNGDEGRIKANDTIFTFNYRSDRMREITTVLGQVEKGLLPGGEEGNEIPEGLEIYTMSQYKKEFPFKVAFPPQAMTNVLAEWLSLKGVKQAHVAGECSLSLLVFLACIGVLMMGYFVETEKYAHVTFFFNGGVEKQFKGEERYMVPSPKVATYDLQPEVRPSHLTNMAFCDLTNCTFASLDERVGCCGEGQRNLGERHGRIRDVQFRSSRYGQFYSRFFFSPLELNN